MPREDIIAAMRVLAGELAEAARTRVIASRDDISYLGLLNGALYGIHRAAELDYDDSRKRPNPLSHLREFAEATGALAHDAPLPAAWIAGYHFGNAVIRLDILREHLNISADSHELYSTVHRAANNFKHVRPAMMIRIDERKPKQQRFDAVLSDALQVAAMLIRAFVDRLPPAQR